MIEKMGFARFLKGSKAVKIQSDSTGILYRIKDTRAEWQRAMVRIRDVNSLGGFRWERPAVNRQFVLVTNSTAEPDGTFKKYLLSVPPTIKTAKAGVAWTFGVKEKDYKPQKES